MAQDCSPSTRGGRGGVGGGKPIAHILSGEEGSAQQTQIGHAASGDKNHGTLRSKAKKCGGEPGIKRRNSRHFTSIERSAPSNSQPQQRCREKNSTKVKDMHVSCATTGIAHLQNTRKEKLAWHAPDTRLHHHCTLWYTSVTRASASTTSAAWSGMTPSL